MRAAVHDQAPPPRTLAATTFAALPEVIPAGVCGAAVVLVLLLDVGRMTNALAWPLSVLAFVVVGGATVLLVRRTRAVERGGRWSTWIDAAALLAAVAAALINARYASQHVLVDRDPAVYNTTAQWLVHHASLPAHDDFSVFGHVPVNAGRIGWGYNGSGFLPQGMHGVPVLAAMVGRVAGDANLLRANAVLGGIGLLAIYAFARTIVARGWALVVALALGMSLPQIHFTRDTYSESLGQIAVWAGLALVARARTQPRIWPLALAGAVFGASMVSRTDAFLGFVCVAAVVVLLVAFAASEERRSRSVLRGAAFVGSVVVAFAVGFFDLVHHTGSYYHDLHGSLRQVLAADLAAGVAAVVVVLVVWYARPIRDLVAARRTILGAAAAGVIGVIFAGLAARPLFETSRTAPSPSTGVIENVQKGAGIAIDPTRTYTEHSVEWMSYYLGPITVVLGLVGICLLVRRLVGSGDLALVPVLALVLPVSLGYFLQPSITPDQIWAARRFLPIVMPGLLIASVVVLESIAVAGVRARARWVRPVALLVAGVVGLATVAVPLAISKPLLRVREYTLDLELLQKLCSAAGPHGELLALDGPRGPFHGLYLPGVTSYCDVPTAAIQVPTKAELAVAAAAAAARGSTLWVFTDEADAIEQVSAGPLPATPTLVVNTRMWRPEVTTVPHTVTLISIDMYVGRVNADGSVSVVPGTGGLGTTFG